MKNKIYDEIKSELASKPKELKNTEQWLFVIVNLAKSIIDNSSRNDLDQVLKLADCDSTRQIQYEFDIIQGKFGREGFSQRYSPNYLYLCSLAANFSDQKLSIGSKELIRQYCAAERYLLYEI